MKPVQPSEPSSEIDGQDPDPAEALNQVIDDSGPREACGRWAVQQLAAGQTVEAVVEELISGGWSTDDAEEIAEQARRQTRHLRGGATQSDVAAAYETTSPSMRAEFIPGSPFTSVFALYRAIARLWRTRNVGRKKWRTASKKPE
jgi:hypothetical protein